MRRTPPAGFFRSAAFLATILLLFTISAAEAASPRYSYIEGGWFKVDPDRGGSDDGAFVGGSYGLRRIHIFAEYSDPGPYDIWEVGGGWHGLLGDRADLVLQASWLDLDYDDGLRVEGGIRWLVVDQFEINGFVSYTDYDSSSDTAVSANGIWDFTDRLGVGGGIEAGDNVNFYRAFLRFNFKKRS